MGWIGSQGNILVVRSPLLCARAGWISAECKGVEYGETNEPSNSRTDQDVTCVPDPVPADVSTKIIETKHYTSKTLPCSNKAL